MSDKTSGSPAPAPAKTPFDWLQGGIFFGSRNNNNNNNNNQTTPNNNNTTPSNVSKTNERLESIDTCKDVSTLLHGIAENLSDMIRINNNATNSNENTTTTTITPTTENQPDVTSDAIPPAFDATAELEITKSTDEENEEVSKFIAARLARLRFLLYDERRITSQQYDQYYYNSNNNPNNVSNNHHWRNPLAAATNFLSGSSHPVVAGTTIRELTSPPPPPPPTTTTTSTEATTTDTTIIITVSDLIPNLIQHLIVLPFESRKHVAAIFNYLLVCGLDGSDCEIYRDCMISFVLYVQRQFVPIMNWIVTGHNTSTTGGQQTDIGLHYGSMYRSIIRHPILYTELVGTTERVSQFVFPFLDQYVHVPNFEISSDAMESIRQVFNTNPIPSIGGGSSSSSSSNTQDGGHPHHRPIHTTGSGFDPNSEYYYYVDDETMRNKMAYIAAEFLTRDYIAIWDERYNPKLLSDTANYMTRRVALQILSTVLLTRSNYTIMIQYVANRTNLILVMKLLRDTSPHITLDAFHVFKVFVANPNKPPEICKILKDNQLKLIRYLATLHQEKEETDLQFRDEKALIIATIEAL